MLLKVIAVSLLLTLVGSANNEFYKDKVVPGTQVSCCTKKDCVPLAAWRQDHLGEYEIYLPHGFWFKPQQSVVRVEHTPDGRAHACYQERDRMNYAPFKITVFCVWIPIPTT